MNNHNATGQNIPERLRRYLQAPTEGKAVRLLEELYCEALELTQALTWSCSVTRPEFFESFAPYAEQSSALTKLLSDAHQVWLLAATIGPDLENKSQEYFERRETFRSYMLDRMGSYLVEQQIQALDHEVNQKCLEAGCQCTHRFSPGYGDFSIQAQSVFARLLKEAMPALSLSSGCIFFPQKTVTAVKGASSLRAAAC